MTATLFKYCIQCRDFDTNTVGDFIYHAATPFKAVSPVFDDLVGLYEWMNANLYAMGQGADFNVYKLD